LLLRFQHKRTRFTSTNVQILTPEALRAKTTFCPRKLWMNLNKLTCFTSTKVQILTLPRLPDNILSVKTPDEYQNLTWGVCHKTDFTSPHGTEVLKGFHLTGLRSISTDKKA